MVAFSEALNKVDGKFHFMAYSFDLVRPETDYMRIISEFWWIRSLIASTARGVRHRPPPKPRANPAPDSDSESDYGNGDDEHEAYVSYFISLPYST